MNKITFILGAGASAEVGLPVGAKLKEDISKFFRTEAFPNSDIYQVICHQLTNRNHEEINKYITAAQAINRAMPLASSIDNFIESRNDNIYIYNKACQNGDSTINNPSREVIKTFLQKYSW